MDKEFEAGKPLDTIAITQSLGLQTFRKSRRRWTNDDDALLQTRLNQMYPEVLTTQDFDASKVDWRLIAEAFGGTRKAKECRRRWVALLDPNLRRGRWTAEEDSLLMEQYNKHGSLWHTIARNIEGRLEHQCCKRYREILDPDVRGRLKRWTESEDVQLVRMIVKHGTKWNTIASELELRLPLSCRNRWRTLVTHVARGRATPLILNTISELVGGKIKDHLPDLLMSLDHTDAHSDSHVAGVKRAPDTQDYMPPHPYPGADSHTRGYLDGLGGFHIKQEHAGELSEPSDHPSDTHSFPHTLLDTRISGQQNTPGVTHKTSAITPQTDFAPSLSMHVDPPPPAETSALATALSTRSDEEWTFSLLLKDKDGIQLKGSILPTKLVRLLVLHTSPPNVDINVHHHVHHHYQNTLEHTQAGDYPGGDSDAPYAKGTVFSHPLPQGYADLESQRKRHHHFTQLPSQSLMPHLTSSVVEGSARHHLHHAKDENKTERAPETVIGRASEPSGAPTRTVRMVNEHFPDLAPFDNIDRPAKRAKASEGAGNELELFETNKKLTEHDSRSTVTLSPDSRPVSQHNPPHYTDRNISTESVSDMDAEDLIDSYGLFWHLFSNEPPVESLCEDYNPFGAMPFNPS